MGTFSHGLVYVGPNLDLVTESVFLVCGSFCSLQNIAGIGADAWVLSDVGKLEWILSELDVLIEVEDIMWILNNNSAVRDNIQVEVEVLILAIVRLIIWDGFLLSFELIHCNLSWLMSAIESDCILSHF